MRQRKWVGHHGKLELARTSPSAASSDDRDEHAGMVQNFSLSEWDEISPVTVTTIEEEGCGTISGTAVVRRENSVLTVNLDVVLRRVGGRNGSLAAAVFYCKGRMRNLDKNVKEEDLSAMASL